MRSDRFHASLHCCTLWQRSALLGEISLRATAKSSTSAHICFGFDAAPPPPPLKRGPAVKAGPSLSLSGGSLRWLLRVERTGVEEISSLNVLNSPMIARAPTSPSQICFHWVRQPRGVCQTLLPYNKAKSGVYYRGHERYPAVMQITAQPFISEYYTRDKW